MQQQGCSSRRPAPTSVPFASNSTFSPSDRSSSYFCELCNKTMHLKDQTAHDKGKQHKQKMQRLKISSVVGLRVHKETKQMQKNAGRQAQKSAKAGKQGSAGDENSAIIHSNLYQMYNNGITLDLNSSKSQLHQQGQLQPCSVSSSSVVSCDDNSTHYCQLCDRSMAPNQQASHEKGRYHQSKIKEKVGKGTKPLRQARKKDEKKRELVERKVSRKVKGRTQGKSQHPYSEQLSPSTSDDCLGSLVGWCEKL